VAYNAYGAAVSSWRGASVVKVPLPAGQRTLISSQRLTQEHARPEVEHHGEQAVAHRRGQGELRRAGRVSADRGVPWSQHEVARAGIRPAAGVELALVSEITAQDSLRGIGRRRDQRARLRKDRCDGRCSEPAIEQQYKHHRERGKRISLALHNVAS
jgi:hypothetical protein